MEGKHLDSKTIMLLIMDYLHDNQLYNTLLSLEEETSINLYNYCSEIKFFRQLILDAQWEDAEHFLLPLKSKNFNHEAVIFEIKRQKFLEMIDSNESYIAYVNALKELENLCTKDQFNSLCY